MEEVENLILGAGISGLAAGQCLFELSKNYLILEKNSEYGGMCRSFKIDGFTFDYFIHLSFTRDELVRKYFDQIPNYTHEPNPFNYYHGVWIKHPAQNNLFPISEEEKEKVIQGFLSRNRYEKRWNENYEYWLRYQFGDYFAEQFPMTYTRKYWGVEAKELETKWVGDRVYQPTLDEIKTGMRTPKTPITYYAKEMRYPKIGGYAHYMDIFNHKENIRLNEKIIEIKPLEKIVITDKGKYHYTNLFSSIPLPELNHVLVDEKNNMDGIWSAGSKLVWTSGYLISLGLQGELPRKDLWDYIYDESVYTSRYYSPSQMSENNAPVGCSSIQAEIYCKYDVTNFLPQKECLLEDTINQLDFIGALNKNKIIVKDIRFSKYTNIIFDKNIYTSRNVIINYLKKMEIIPIGRYGSWQYLWSDQSFLSGYNAVKEVYKKSKVSSNM